MGINSIWQNTFYNTSPVPKWAFEVDFSSFFLKNGDGHILNEQYPITLNQAIVSCSWPSRDITLIPTYYAGIEAKLPGRAQNAKELSIKFNENEKMEVITILENIFHAEALCDSYFTDNSGYAYNQNFNKVNRKIVLKIHKPNITMNQNKDLKTEIAEITFHNCILSKIDDNEMSYESEEVISYTTTFSFDYMTIKGNKNAGTYINGTCDINKG